MATFELVKESLLHAIVCTDGTPAEAADWMMPSGTSHGWVPATLDDIPDPVVTCQKYPDTHTHVVVLC